MNIIYHHLGLGDHFICNGLVREIVKNNPQEYILLAKGHNFSTVCKMYSDIEMQIVNIKDDDDANKFISENKECNVLRIGFEFLDTTTCSFDESFYRQFKIPFIKRWSSFFMPRDKVRELEVFKNYNVKENEYIFVHDDITRGFNININGNNIVKPRTGITDNIGDFMYLVENAKEIHCIDSSFRMMIDSFDFSHKKLFFHTRVRTETLLANSKNKWILV